ncbi:hypothetical protein CPAR01_04953 [Colletotrichum paranaense]|uniref:Uncharacterized protein n=1 Tax=Colletotrichum paranaense TaxID=1914294 RepID=A0ABQ9SXU6_9PEZI|nr:uncharacterized protein CPAR01_04953 [Colletotrichum paranaense]KAK1544320.1 hypothetical protein CPAR01_04953 [Colletotrichum paranaense]
MLVQQLRLLLQVPESRAQGSARPSLMRPALPLPEISTPPPARQPVGLFSEVAFPTRAGPPFTTAVGVAARHTIPDLAAAPMQRLRLPLHKRG